MNTLDEFYGPVEWIWENWIPRGHITMVVGQQDVGKSYFGALLIAILGGYQPTWPDNTPGPASPQKVYVVENENMTPVYKERLIALGAHPPWNWIYGPVRTDNPYECMRLDDPLFTEVVSDHASGFGADMILIDSLSGGHSMRENEATMRRLLQPLTQLAAGLDIPVIIVHHLRKGRGRDDEPSHVTLDKVRGSTTTTQFCRSAIGLWRREDKDRNPTDQLVLQSVKSTFCPKPSPIGMRIQGGQFVFETGPIEVTIIPTSVSQQKVEDFLNFQLKDGPVSRKAVLEARYDWGLGKNSIYRGVERLGILRIKIEGVTCWKFS